MLKSEVMAGLADRKLERFDLSESVACPGGGVETDIGHLPNREQGNDLIGQNLDLDEGES